MAGDPTLLGDHGLGLARVGGDGRMIVSIVCDGIDLVDDELAGALQQPLSDFNRVEMHSANPSELVLDALTQDRKSVV